MSQRIAVLGTGANGASIAADLIIAGFDVVLIEQWPEHVQEMRRSGIRIEMPEEVLETPVEVYHLCEVCSFDFQFDVVLLVMKAYDTIWGCQLIKPYLKDDGVLVGVQNGMTTDNIIEVVGIDRTMGCVIEISSQMFLPGVVERQSSHDHSWFAVGGLSNQSRKRELEIKKLLSHSGTTVISSDIQSAKWMKIVSNCTTLGTTAVFGVPIAEAASNPVMRDIMIKSGLEALDAGLEKGYRLEPIFGLSEKEVSDSNQLVELLLNKLTSTYILPQTITTVLQDHMKNRKSEVENVNGWVVEERHSVGKKAPVNMAILKVSKLIKNGELEPDPSNVGLIKDLVKDEQ